MAYDKKLGWLQWKAANPEKYKANRAKWNRSDKAREQSSIKARLPGGRYSRAKSLAKYREIEFSLNLNEYLRLLSHCCVYCSGPLNPTGMGLDRKDNKLGYTLSNAVPCCRKCNVMKGSELTFDEMFLVLNARKAHAQPSGL